MDHNQVVAFILTEATYDELSALAEAMKMRRAQLARKNIYTLRPGDSVTFTSRGREIKGTVAKVMQKNVTVKEAGTITVWRVPASMLSKETA